MILGVEVGSKIRQQIKLKINKKTKSEMECILASILARSWWFGTPPRRPETPKTLQLGAQDGAAAAQDGTKIGPEAPKSRSRAAQEASRRRLGGVLEPGAAQDAPRPFLSLGVGSFGDQL